MKYLLLVTLLLTTSSFALTPSQLDEFKPKKEFVKETLTEVGNECKVVDDILMIEVDDMIVTCDGGKNMYKVNFGTGKIIKMRDIVSDEDMKKGVHEKSK
ncbi:MAG: hypothetical protein ACOYMW_08035 [Candidatus Competibacteraceae bacterium]